MPMGMNNAMPMVMFMTTIMQIVPWILIGFCYLAFFMDSWLRRVTDGSHGLH